MWYPTAGHDSVAKGRENREEERRKGKEERGKKEGEREKNVQDSPGECIYREIYHGSTLIDMHDQLEFTLINMHDQWEFT